MSARMQRLFAPPAELGVMGPGECSLHSGVLAVTTDIRLFKCPERHTLIKLGEHVGALAGAGN